MSATDSGIVIPGQRTMAPQERLAVTLEAQQWNAVLTIISEASIPHRVSDPLLREIQRQCMMASRRGSAEMSRGNGAERAERSEAPSDLRPPE